MKPEIKKYPKTPHFSFSQEFHSDDSKLETLEGFEGKEVIVSEKMDGENTTIYKDYLHPRSTIDDGHPSRNWLKGFAPTFQYLMDEDLKICGENMYARHSVPYDELESYFYVFNIWKGDECLSYDDTLEWCEFLGLVHVPVFYRGEFHLETVKDIFESLDKEKNEGVVCRITDQFHRDDFEKYVAKAVREGHVQTDEHWKKNWVKNGLKEE